MNADIIEIAEYLESNTVEGLINKAVNAKDVEDEITELNTKGQLGKFQDSRGRFLADIHKPYALITQLIRGVGARDIDLKDSGDYWKSFTIDPISLGFEINSDPIKKGKSLEKRYGKHLEGLTKENEKKANVIIEYKVWDQAQESL